MGLISILCIFQPIINALSDAPSLPVAGRCQYRRCASDHPVRQEIAAACGELQASNYLQALIACHICPAPECSNSAERCCLQQDRSFSFQPGQWIDFHAPGVPIIGGYSIVSPPSQLTSLRTFDIAVKQSSHSPAHWVHTQVLIWLQL